MQILAVGPGDKLSLVANQQRPVVLQFLPRLQFRRPGRFLAAIVPCQAARRHVAPRGKFKFYHGSPRRHFRHQLGRLHQIHGGWRAQLQRPKRAVHDVARHVSDGPAAKIPPAAPHMRAIDRHALVFRPARHKRPRWRRAKPQIPIQIRRHRIRTWRPVVALHPARSALDMDGPVGPTMHLAHRADGPRRDQFT